MIARTNEDPISSASALTSAPSPAARPRRDGAATTALGPRPFLGVPRTPPAEGTARYDGRVSDHDLRLAEPETQRALTDFLTDPADGLFRGPYLRIRQPFRTAEGDWQQHLDWWQGGDFRPYAHQAEAFARLTTKGGHVPLPTLITTGTGSGKTESFLLPVIDHCRRAKAAGKPGVKAVLLYPMNALAGDRPADSVISWTRTSGSPTSPPGSTSVRPVRRRTAPPTAGSWSSGPRSGAIRRTS
ncbi:DEAD/DEAH box helicase [Streptomyces sp. P9-A4]|uniref:DEAD/DEAH box helicase n=1 Tax=Streptomyces sp. P9-A4 TaxID=3072285 RepID=UPI003FCCC247